MTERITIGEEFMAEALIRAVVHLQSFGIVTRYTAMRIPRFDL